MSRKLGRDFYLRSTLEVARDLIGKEFVKREKGRTLSGRIVEAEAYIGESDPACHAARGKTKRNWVMYEEGGLTYVYFVYGMYNMLNFVAEPAGKPAAVLIRALEPLDGVATMLRRRRCANVRQATSGPGKICQAFGIDVKHTALDLTGDKWFVLDNDQKPGDIAASSRIGIREGLDKLWRFFDPKSDFVSPVKAPQV